MAYTPTARYWSIDRRREIVGMAIELMPPPLVERAGVPPLRELPYRTLPFVGLWSEFWPDSDEDRAASGRYYRAAGKHKQAVITLHPEGAGFDDAWLLGTLLHEWGHHLWFTLGWRTRRPRTFSEPDDPSSVIVKRKITGMIPASLPMSTYVHRFDGEDAVIENFAEAVRLWLTPQWAMRRKRGEHDASRMYAHNPRSSLGHWRERTDNRHMLAVLNELAGWDFDRPPRSMR